ncbi:MAG: isocitrate lyase/phosphoenolpyruvate mutase family protein, partial [Caldisericia bacterium]|nr:isocitrate lyase/phosphoenolpyruvate mutase family protein [Caldisericia bacterium]
MKRKMKLKELIKKEGLIRLVGAHNGLTAKLVEKHGFEGIWASGFEISASHASPDANILTMSDSLAAAIDMVDS